MVFLAIIFEQMIHRICSEREAQEMKYFQFVKCSPETTATQNKLQKRLQNPILLIRKNIFG